MDRAIQAVWETLTPEEKCRSLYERQAAALKTLLERGAVTQEQYE